MPTSQILFGVVVVPAIIGLVQVLKQAGLPANLSPLVAVLIGVMAGLAEMQATKWPWIGSIVIGISLGLSAVGLYTGVSAVAAHTSFGSTAPQDPSPAASPPTTASVNKPL